MTHNTKSPKQKGAPVPRQPCGCLSAGTQWSPGWQNMYRSPSKPCSTSVCYGVHLCVLVCVCALHSMLFIGPEPLLSSVLVTMAVSPGAAISHPCQSSYHTEAVLSLACTHLSIITSPCRRLGYYGLKLGVCVKLVVTAGMSHGHGVESVTVVIQPCLFRTWRVLLKQRVTSCTQRCE